MDKENNKGYAVEGQVDLSTVNDRDTGIEFPSDDRIQFYAGGVAVQDLQSVSGGPPVYGTMVVKVCHEGGKQRTPVNPFGYDVLIKGAFAVNTPQVDGFAGLLWLAGASLNIDYTQCGDRDVYVECVRL